MPGNRRPSAPERISLGIVLKRSRARDVWGSDVWRVDRLLLGGGAADVGRAVPEEDGSTRYYAGSLSLALFADQVESYRYNLGSRTPAVYVVLRPADGALALEPFLVTVCPVEAQDYMDDGEEVVEAVPMPDAIAAWLGGFVARFPAPEPFRKRKRDDKAPNRDTAGKRPARPEANDGG
jgi:hypothetical protein